MINSAIFSQKEEHFLIQATKMSCFASKSNKVVAIIVTLSLASLHFFGIFISASQETTS